MSKPETFFAPCPRGLESVLVAELNALGAQAVAAVDGGVGFQGPFELCYRVNLYSRVASRVLWRLARGPYRNEQEVYTLALKINWPSYFNVEQTFAIDTVARKSPLKSLNFVTLKIKDAVCDRFRDATGGHRPSVDTHHPDVRIQLFLTAEDAAIYLDTSGENLFKRGYRLTKGEAPLKENLAAGILRLTSWQPGTPLYDPMCGSGTFLTEATLIALNIAPGQGRDFGFERLKNFDAVVWAKLKQEARAAVRPLEQLPIHGSDLASAAIEHARQNFSDAGLSDIVTLRQLDVLDAAAPAASGVLIMNPPYGERIGEQEALAALYPKLASVLKQRFAGWTAYILTADTRLPSLMRLKPSRKTPLFNGPIECRLYEFKLVAGSNR
jgi:putative N6-adenine-specific DNA methylase